MELVVDDLDRVKIVAIHVQALDASNAKEFKKDIAPMLESNADILLDMSKLEFLDSSGIGTILACLKALRESGHQLKLYSLTKAVRSVFELVRMHRLIDIYNTREEALRSLGVES